MERGKTRVKIKSGGAAMRAIKYLKVLLMLAALSLCLPWFTYNAKVMGYCHGYAFLKLFLVPVVVIGVCLFYPKREILPILMAEISLLACFFILIYAFGFWQEVCNIQAGAQWRDGFRTVQPGFWTSACFFILLFICFQIELVKGGRKKAV